MTSRRSLLSVPAFLWFLSFIFIPLMMVLAVSFATRGTYGGFAWTLSIDNFQRSFTPAYLGILLQSLKVAGLTTFICAVVGFLMAWAMATASPRSRYFYVCAVALPFLTNLVIRIYAIRVFVGYEGPLQRILTGLGIPLDPFSFSQNQWLVYYGMVTTYLPFMVLPLYGAFEKFDFSLVEAAQDLGAGSWEVLKDILLPNLRKALISGAVLVFVPALGEYVIPDLLGGAKNMLLGNLITEEFLKARDWPLGSALSIVLILILLLVATLLTRASGEKYGR